MKKRVDYVSLIWLHRLNDDFERYCRKHRGISLRRNARNFLLKKGFYHELNEYRQRGFEFDIENLYHVAHTEWLDK